MKKFLPKISNLVITLVFFFVMSGFLFPQTAHAGFWDIVDCGLSPVDCALRNFTLFISSTALQLTSLFTGLSGIVLNGVIYYTIVKISDNYSGIPAISEAWKVIRDVANMGFIFVLLYAAIKTILGIGEDTQKLIRNIIIVAVLINFSLFFTKLVIDASNVLALAFYDAIAPEALNVAGTGDILGQRGLSNAFMQHLDLQTIYQSTGAENISPGTIITIGAMGSIMLLIAAFVFFAVAIMFIIRYVILILVLILSPIAFVSFVLPGLSGQGKKWWDALSGQAFFAPIYFMLTFVTLRVLGGITNSFNNAGVTTVTTNTALSQLALINGEVTGSSGAFGMFISFTVVIVFLIASLVIAKDWANKAGPGVTGLTKWAMGAAGGASFGLAGRVGRYTLGAGAEAFKETKAYKRLEAKSAEKSAAGMLSRLTLATADKTRTSSFDIRGSRLGGVLAGTGLEAGQAKQGGFEAERKAVEEFLERPGTEAYKKRQERAENAENELAVRNGTKKGATQSEIDAMEKAMAKMSDKEIEAIVSSNRELLDKQDFANALSVKQLEAINKSDKFSETEKTRLKSQRFGDIDNALRAGGPVSTDVANKIKSLSDSELEMINPEHLTNPEFVSQMRGSQFEAISKSNKFTSSQKKKLKDIRKGSLLQALDASNPGYAPTSANIDAALKKIRQMGGKDFVELMTQDITPTPGATPIPLLTHPTVLPILKPNMLKKMITEMNDTQVSTLRAALLAHGSPTTIAWLNNPATGGSEFS